MIQFESEKVYIEHCQNCSSHSWCTNHDESKYKSYFETCKQKISDLCPELETLSNQIPIFFSDKFSISESRPWEGRMLFPRIGSFEVYFKSKVIFSKLETGLWPQASLIASRIQEMLNKPILPQISKEKPKNQRKRAKMRDSKSNDSKSTRGEQKRYKSTTPLRKLQKKHDFSYKAIKSKAGDSDDADFERDSSSEPKKITKVYELVLPCGSVSNKVRLRQKINYVNKGHENCEFTLQSSDPVGMIIKESSVVIPAGEIGKFQLRFAPVSSPTSKSFILTVENHGNPWECFKFQVKYE